MGDRRERIGLWLERMAKPASYAAVVTLALLVAFVVVFGPKIWATANDAQVAAAVARGNDVTACRARYAAAVTSATSHLQALNAELTADKSELDVGTNRALRALAARDDAAFNAALAPAPEQESTVLTASEAVRASERSVNTANDAYQAAVRMAADDQAGFLRQCQGG